MLPLSPHTIKSEDSPDEPLLPSGTSDMFAGLYSPAPSNTTPSTAIPTTELLSKSLPSVVLGGVNSSGLAPTPTDKVILSALAMTLPETSPAPSLEDSLSPDPEREDSLSPEGGSDKKQSKKRKSWGQVLPEPKTNLPPRKRAKTDDEKEQRRVERVLRNRRAAQSSRERKRLEVEALERRNKELEARIHTVERANFMLIEELNKFRHSTTVPATASSNLSALESTPVTLSQDLFSTEASEDRVVPNASSHHGNSLDELILPSSSGSTVDPSSLSPEPPLVSSSTPLEKAYHKSKKVVRIKMENDETFLPSDETDALVTGPSSQVTSRAVLSDSSESSSPGLTQRPAEMLCDLPCQVLADEDSLRVSRTTTTSLSSRKNPNPTKTSTTSSTTAEPRQPPPPLTSSPTPSDSLTPLMLIALSLRASYPLPPNPSILTTIVWLVTRPPSRKTLTSPTLSTSKKASTRLSKPSTQPQLQTQPPSQATTPPTQPQPTTTSKASAAPRSSHCHTPSPTTQRISTFSPSLRTLRIKTLRKILTCSPSLARPLLDATTAVLRLVPNSSHSCFPEQDGPGTENSRHHQALPSPRDHVSVSGGLRTPPFQQSFWMTQSLMQQSASEADRREEQEETWASISRDDGMEPVSESDIQREVRTTIGQVWPRGAALPSREALITLMWAVRVEAKKIVLERLAGCPARGVSEVHVPVCVRAEG